MYRPTPSLLRASRRGGGARAVTVAAIATLTLSCGDSGTEPPPQPPAPVATSLTVTPASAEFAALGETVQFAAEVRDQNGQAMAGAPVTWSSSDAAVATVGSAGLVTAAGNGAATVTATSGSASGTAAVTVAQRVGSVAVLPDGGSVVERDTVRFEAQATDANGHPVAGAGFSWASSDTLVAVVDDAGLVTGVGAGEAELTATADGVTGHTGLTVMAAVPTTVTVAPDTVGFASLGDTVRLVAEVRDQIERLMEGESVAWSSSDAAVATVGSAGLVTAAGDGSATVTATAGEASDQVVISVEQRTARVAVAPVPDTLVPGDTVRLTAEATDANGHLIAGAAFAWSSSDTLVATVDAAGLVTATGLGAAVVSAAVDEIDGSATIAVESPVRVAFIDDSVRLVEGETRNVGIRYRVRRLAAPLPIWVSAIDDGVEPADYALSETRFEIPAGSGFGGLFEVAVTAATDGSFAEGEERLSLALVVPGGSGTAVGAALPVAIADAPVSPSPGITLSGTPPEPLGAVEGFSHILARDRIRTTLTSEWHPSSQGVSMRWIGPYGERREWVPHNPGYKYADQTRPHPPPPDFHIESWRVRSRNSVVTHVMDVSWSAESRLQLLFGGDAGVECAADGCSMTDRAGTANATSEPRNGQESFSRIPYPVGHPGPSETWSAQSLASHEWDTPRAIGNGVYGSSLTSAPAPLSSATPPTTAATRAANRYLLFEDSWHPSVWPPGDTLVFHLSSANWPENARMTPEEVKDLLSEMLAEWSDIPTADILWRVEGPVDIQPGRDGKNIFFLQPEYEHGLVGSPRWYDMIDGVWGLVELDHSLGRPNEAPTFSKSVYDTPWPYIVNEMGMHPLGHTLGLGHAASFPIARSCPGPTYAINDCGPVNGDFGYWRRVSGVWPLDPVMSGGVSGSLSWTDDGRALRLDDKIGASLLRPKPGWLATTGTISGSVRTEDGWPAPHIHIWAVRPTEEGRMDGVGAFADRYGSFEIRGLPPGDWILVAHPDVEWIANPLFFYQRQGALLDEMLLYPVRARAGQTTGGIEIIMGRGRVTTVR